jgi:hypothetical protein
MYKTSILLLLFLISHITFGQRFDILSGKLENLKGISEYNVLFDYNDLQVNGFDSEAAYLKEKIEKRKNYDNGKDLKGKAEKFEKDWYADRQDKYEPAFIDYFNKRFENGEVIVGKNSEAKYTMTLKTLWVYPGYELAQVEPAKISAIITISETANPSNILLAIKFEKSIGIIKDHREQGDRIAGAYEKLAKNLVIQLKRIL